MKYPRPLTEIHQIEVTTFCDLRCSYCPSRHLEGIRKQPKQDMTLEVYERALQWAAWFDAQGTQRELSLTGIGETLLHPDLYRLAELARQYLPTTYINFSTNGLKLTDEICEVLAEHKIRLWVSLHRPEKAAWAIEKAKRFGILDGSNPGAGESSFDWAGQVDHPVLAPRRICDWLNRGWANVLVDGRITVCCFDAPAIGVVGHVDDDIGTVGVKPFSLCPACHLVPPEEDE